MAPSLDHTDRSWTSRAKFLLMRQHVSLWEIGPIRKPVPSLWHDPLYHQKKFRYQSIREIHFLLEAFQHLVVLFHVDVAAVAILCCSALLPGSVSSVIIRPNYAHHLHHSNRDGHLFLLGPILDLPMDHSALQTIAERSGSRAGGREALRRTIYCATSELITRDANCYRFHSRSHCGIIF